MRIEKCRSSAAVCRFLDINFQNSVIATDPTLDYPRNMANNLASFAVHADDVQRCRRFYEAVFGWRFEPWGPPDFYLVHTGGDGNQGVPGLMHKRQEPRSAGGPNCFECTITVDDLDAVTSAIVQHGGRIIFDRTPIPTVGVLTKFQDSEGNVLGAMAYEHPPHT